MRTRQPPLRSKPAPILLCWSALLMVLISSMWVEAANHNGSLPPPTQKTLRLSPPLQGVDKIHLVRGTGQGLRYVLTYHDGRRQSLDAQAFAEMVEQSIDDRTWAQRVLNITGSIGVVWVAVGLLGQLLFTGRLLVQWLASERNRRSVVPEAFWWMSLAGATMLLAYFVWRKDIVGVLGQGTGWAIYARNLYLIHRTNASGPDPASVGSFAPGSANGMTPSS